MFPESLRNISRVTDSELADLKSPDFERRDRPEDGPQMFRISRANRSNMRTASGLKPFGQGIEGLQFFGTKIAPQVSLVCALRFGWLPLFGCAVYGIGFGFVHCFWSSLVDPPACPFSNRSRGHRSMIFHRFRSHCAKK